jgi:circadian clock protein KaiB
MSAYIFDLYIAGHTSRSRQAARSMEKLCEERFPGDYSLNIIDVLDDPQAAEEEKIIATPTLVQRAPLAGRRIIGVPPDSETMLRALGLESIGREFSNEHT